MLFFDYEEVDYGYYNTMRAKYTNMGKKRGVIKNKKRKTYVQNDVYKDYVADHPERFKDFTLLNDTEFATLLIGVDDRRDWLMINSKVKRMTFENRILLTMRWVVCYEEYKCLSEKWNTSKYYVSVVINEILPVLVEHSTSSNNTK